MNKLPPLGKITPDFFTKVIYPRLGRKDPSVIVRPQHGVDFGVIALGGRVIVISADPFYIASELGMEKAAWFAVHILASDVAVSGIPAKHLAVDLNLPPAMTEKDLCRMWDAVHRECDKLGISVVTGHTARYAGCNYPMVGGAAMFGIGKRSSLIVPRAKPGDAIVVSKGPAIETTGLLAAYFPDALEASYGKAFVGKAQALFYQMSTVKDAAIVARIGGVSALHDATECGVLGGLYEMAQHSCVGMEISLDDILIQDEAAKTCACFRIDPFVSISEGTLLATVAKRNAKSAVKALEDEGIAACIAGTVVPLRQGIHTLTRGRKRRLSHPETDPFWSTFEEQLRKKAAA